MTAARGEAAVVVLVQDLHLEPGRLETSQKVLAPGNARRAGNIVYNTAFGTICVECIRYFLTLHFLYTVY